MQIYALVRDDSIKLPTDMHLPDGTAVSIVVEELQAVLPPDYFERVTGALAGETLDRPDQGNFESRTEW